MQCFTSTPFTPCSAQQDALHTCKVFCRPQPDQVLQQTGAPQSCAAGPGLAVRVLGDVTQGDALDVLRQVDEVYIQSIRDHGLYDKIWQAFAVFLPVRWVAAGQQRPGAAVSRGISLAFKQLMWAASLPQFLPALPTVSPCVWLPGWLHSQFWSSCSEQDQSTSAHAGLWGYKAIRGRTAMWLPSEQ